MDFGGAVNTLTDNLLDDLDDLSDVDDNIEDVEELGSKEIKESSEVGVAINNKEEQQVNHDDDSDNDDNDNYIREHIGVSKSKVCNILNLQSHLDSIQRFEADQLQGNNNVNGSTLEERQHQLITACSKHINSLQNELHRAHLNVISAYKSKFPELDSLLPDPIAYTNAVRVIQNETDITKVNDQLNATANLTSNQIITLSIAGSTTSGEPLTSSQLKHLNESIQYFDEVLHIQQSLITFVQKHMEMIAPNTSYLIGPTLTARMVASAGGFPELSRIPSCNLQVIGQVKHTSASRAGLSTSISSSTAAAAAAASSSSTNNIVATLKPHEGILSECDLYKRVPPHLQRKALKVIAAKLALAIRCDYVNLETGRPRNKDSAIKFKQEIEDKFLKWEEPDKAPLMKPLPKPDLETKKRRGGKRIRRLKERFEETELMKQANRRGFSVGTGEYGDDAMGLTLGMLEKSKDGSSSGGGDVRHLLGRGEKRKMRQANTKASRKRAVQMSSGQTNGLASSMVFTPVQGLELVNPDARKDLVREANRKWFQDNAGFQSALPKSK